MKTKILLILILMMIPLFGQDEFTPESVYTPFWFAELLDAEVYSSSVVYHMGVGGFVFMDVSNIADPQLIGRYIPGSIWKRFYNGKAKGSLAIGAARLDGLYLISISDMSNPLLFDIYSTGVSYESVDFTGSYAYAAIHESGLEVINISNPGAPNSINILSGFENTWDVFLKGNYLYVADGPGGLKIFSISQPENPQFLAEVNTTGAAREVIVEDQMAFVALGAAGVDIIDVSDPTDPQLLSNYATNFGIVNHLDYSNNRLFTATWELVEAIDVSNPNNPTLLATEDTPVRAMGLAVHNNNVFVTDWSRFRVYSFQDYTAPDIHVKPITHDFGFQGVNVPINQPFEVYNLGESNLNVSNISVGNNSNLFNILPTTISVAPRDVGLIDVTFIPDSPNINVNTKLKFQSDDPDEANKEIHLYGGQSRLSPGDMAPDFTLPALDGNNYTLSNFQGKVVILAFFASW